jgi:hypothetical protein
MAGDFVLAALVGNSSFTGLGKPLQSHIYGKPTIRPRASQQ